MPDLTSLYLQSPRNKERFSSARAKLTVKCIEQNLDLTKSSNKIQKRNRKVYLDITI